MAMTEIIAQEIKDAGPAIFAPIAGRKKIPVPIIALMVMSKMVGKFNTFFSSDIDVILLFEFK